MLRVWGLGFRAGFSLEDEVNVHKSLCIWCYHLEGYCCKCLSTFVRESETRSISWPANLIGLNITLFTQIATQKMKSIIPCSWKVDTSAALKHLSLHASSTMLKPQVPNSGFPEMELQFNLTLSHTIPGPVNIGRSPQLGPPPWLWPSIQTL
jgi:hypothetical protein